MQKVAASIDRIEGNAFQDADMSRRQERMQREGLRARYVGLDPVLASQGTQHPMTNPALPYAMVPTSESISGFRQEFAPEALRGAFGYETEQRMARACARR